MKYVCEKCGLKFDTEEECRRHEEAEDKLVAVRMVSLWFANWPVCGSPISVGTLFKADQGAVRLMEPIVSEFPGEQGDLHIICYPDQVKGALLKLVEAAKTCAQDRIAYWIKARDTVSLACDAVLEKLARGEIK